MKALVPFVICQASFDRLFLEVGKFGFGIREEEELYPFYRVSFQPGTVFFYFRPAQVFLYGDILIYVFFELFPPLKRVSVRLFHRESLINMSHNPVNSFALFMSTGRSQLMNRIPTLIMSAMPTSLSIFLMAAASFPNVSASEGVAYRLARFAFHDDLVYFRHLPV